MGRALVSVLLASAIATATASAAGGDLTVSLTSAKPHAANVGLKASFPSAIQCGYVPSVTITLPAAMGVAPAIPASAVELQGKAPTAVSVKGHTITITRAHSGVLCDVMVEGTVTVSFLPRAHLVNPAGAGTYTVLAGARGPAKLSGTITISR